MSRLFSLSLAGLTVLLVTFACREGGPEELDLRLKPLSIRSSLCPSNIVARSPSELLVGGNLKVTLAPGAFDHFGLNLNEGDFFAVRAGQEGVDLVLCLYNPQGRLLLPVDRPTAREEPEELAGVAPETGRFVVGIKAFGDANQASYGLRVERGPRPARREIWQAEASTATALAEVWQRQEGRAAALKAAQLLEFSLARWRQLGNEGAQGDVLYRLGYLRQAIQHDPSRAESVLKRALPLVIAHGGPLAQAQTNAELGQALMTLGRAQESLAYLTAASKLYDQLRELSSYATMLNELGTANQMLGKFQQALEEYEGAARIFRSLREPSREATVLHNRGVLTLTLGRDREAEDDLLTAMCLWRDSPPSTGVREGTVRTLNTLGSIELRRGNTEAALRYFEESLPVRRELGDAAGEAITLGYLGLVEQRLGRFPDALAHHRAAVLRLGKLPLPCVRARALMQLGAALDSAGDLEAAEVSLSEARREVRTCGDPFLETAVLTSSAQISHRAGNLTVALEYSQECRLLVERLRAAPRSRVFRVAFFATKQQCHDLSIDFLMELAAREPGVGHDKRALELFEGGLARSLLDLVQKEGGTLRRDVPEKLRAKRRVIEASLRRRHREVSLESPFGMEGRSESDERIRSLLRELDDVETAILQSSSEPSSLAAVTSMSIDQIVREVLDSGTLALYYKLGRDQSYLWALGTDGVESFRLPGRDKLEPLVRQAHDLLSSRGDRVVSVQLELTLRRLSELLLGPLKRRISSKRLVIVSNESLQLLPFAVLPSPANDGGGRPLVVTNEIVVEPSLSVVAAIARASRAHPRSSKGVAIFADPVFSPHDPRVRHVPSASVMEGERQSGSDTYDRLVFSRREAELIAELVPRGNLMLHLDFEANRQNLEKDQLEEYGTLHFATHSTVDQGNPELSHIVLSLVDRGGRPQDGILYAYDIHNLHLAADLVVLSSCDSELGQEIQGEGLVGLPYAFLDAGAKRVLASLWSVGDNERTAGFMARIYRSYISDRLSPAAALRQAQIEQWRESPSDPFWSAFVIQGPWR